MRLRMALTLLVGLCAAAPAVAQQNPNSVFLENLTWVEVRDAIKAGKTTAIIPTGGTEQNGPHMALGKHNILVKYKAGEIAKALGNAIVAPVLAKFPRATPGEAGRRPHEVSGTIRYRKSFTRELWSPPRAGSAGFIGSRHRRQRLKSGGTEGRVEKLTGRAARSPRNITDYIGRASYRHGQRLTMEEVGGHDGARKTTSFCLSIVSDARR